MEEFAATVAVHTAPEQGGNPPDILEAQEEVGARIDSLSPLLYDTLTAIAVDGIDVDLVAEVEGVTPDVIYKRLERAKTIVKGE
jgi:DNA-directed RNA polymerase specialized sigma24 family protein